MTTKVFRTMHASDGKFTYTDQDGNVILANSKKCYEFFSPVAYASAKGCVFGTAATCAKAIRQYRLNADKNAEYLRTHKESWIEKYGIEDYNKQLVNSIGWLQKAEQARVIKIETK